MTMNASVPDIEIVHQITSAREDSGWAEAALYRRFAPRIELYGRKHLGSRPAAEDLVQQVITLVLQAIRAGRLENPEQLASFVLGTCRNVTWDIRRSEQRQRKLEREAVGSGGAEPPARFDSEDVLRLFGCMTSLPEREARVVRMSFWEDRPAEEIGVRLGVSPGNVRVLRHRALVKLAGCMHREGGA